MAERFFGRSKNRKKEVREGIFTFCPWGHEKKEVVLCYDCHEELIHNPVFLLDDIERFAALVKRRGLSEDRKSDDKSKLAGRIRLLREIIDAGLHSVASKDEANKAPEPTPGLVTPRALARVLEMKRWNEIRDVARGAPSPVVAHL